jgi:hypothetical protein
MLQLEAGCISVEPLLRVVLRQCCAVLVPEKYSLCKAALCCGAACLRLRLQLVLRARTRMLPPLATLIHLIVLKAALYYT